MIRIADLFCGPGGASFGMVAAGCRVVGIDIEDQKYYPFEFIQKDVFKLSLENLENIDFVWASPPCQAYSLGSVKYRNAGKKYPDLIAKTREMLDTLRVPYVIENVPGAPIRKDLVLCGEMFNLNVIRHRYFEISGFKVKQPEHRKHTGSVYKGTRIGVWTGGKPGCFGNRKKYHTVAGHWNGKIDEWQDAIKISWVQSKHALAQCVPPAYSKFIIEQYIKNR